MEGTWRSKTCVLVLAFFPRARADSRVYPHEYGHVGSFPPGFKWGLGTASHQVEGGFADGGRGLNIWDVFTGADASPINPGMEDGRGQTGSVACDTMHKFREDVAMIAALGLKSYRFSISWPRLLRNGTLAGGLNAQGVAYYNALLDELVGAGIEPHVTLYHWDLPQALLDDPHSGHRSELNGWLDARLPRLFAEYAGECFRLFGDRVKLWYTFNEAWTFVALGYTGAHAPSLCNWRKGGCAPTAGTEPYLAAHHVLLAHGHAVRVFRERGYAKAQGGRIGMTNNIDWSEPLTQRAADVAAAARANEWWLGWFADPVWLGDYPESMRSFLGERLPSFSAEEKAMLKGSADVFGLNTYSARWVADDSAHGHGGPGHVMTDGRFKSSASDEWPRSNSSWLRSVPWGMRRLLNYVQARYQPAEIFVTENGWSVGASSAREGVCDGGRIGYLSNYTSEMQRAIAEDGVRVAGYVGWSLMDNFEWAQGYTQRFGLVYVDFDDARRARYLKASACWFAAVAHANALVDPAPFYALCEGGPPARAVPFAEAAQPRSRLGASGRLVGSQPGFEAVCAASFARSAGGAVGPGAAGLSAESQQQQGQGGSSRTAVTVLGGALSLLALAVALRAHQSIGWHSANTHLSTETELRPLSSSAGGSDDSGSEL